MYATPVNPQACAQAGAQTDPIALRAPGFAALGSGFYAAQAPTPLPAPYWVASSAQVAQLLGLDAATWRDDTALQMLSGNRAPAAMPALATVYSGHQFGVWAGQLGDGRALLLGESAQGLEVQLKGAGRTPYSRMGDGRAVLRSSIREFLCSEAMHGLGIPTTRALCLTGSPTPVRRETVETAAVLTRVAPSFVRFGHFEHFYAQGLQQDRYESLHALADHVIARHYPQCHAPTHTPAQTYGAFLRAVSERTATLLAHWQAVGFCHGVMNTDNMSILGLTLDYGPFQFLDRFDPGHVCNHSDTAGRYAFHRQPAIAHWNLGCLAQALLPLLADEGQAVAALQSFQPAFTREFLRRMADKLGLGVAHGGLQDGSALAALVGQLLQLLAAQRVDYPIFWRRLSHAVASGDFAPVSALFAERSGWERWLLSYKELLTQVDQAQAADLMLKTNPKFVLRNHLAEQVIRAAQQGDFTPLQTLQTLLENPFDEYPGHEAWADFPPDWAASITVSCSS
ncbi:MAG: YdiU family protein [Burkholderiaceae bacterium]